MQTLEAGANLSLDLLRRRPFAHSSTSGEGHRGNTQSKSEIIMQTALWGSLMTKVSLRCSSNSALEYQLGLSGTRRWKEVTGIVNASRLSVGTSSTRYAPRREVEREGKRENKVKMGKMVRVGASDERGRIPLSCVP